MTILICLNTSQRQWGHATWRHSVLSRCSPPSHANYGGYLLPPFLPPPTLPCTAGVVPALSTVSPCTSMCGVPTLVERLEVTGLVFATTEWRAGCCKLLNKFSLLKWRVKISLLTAHCILCFGKVCKLHWMRWARDVIRTHNTDLLASPVLYWEKQTCLAQLVIILLG